jgi:hypothetical protein
MQKKVGHAAPGRAAVKDAHGDWAGQEDCAVDIKVSEMVGSSV